MNGWRTGGWMVDRLKACDVEGDLLTLEGAGHGFKGADAEKGTSSRPLNVRSMAARSHSSHANPCS